MDLVTARAELRGLFAMERLDERVAVRTRREVDQRIVCLLQDWMLAGGEIVERRVFDREVALPHRAADVHDGVAGRAGQTGLRFRRRRSAP
jgi:hypothetical protein